MPSISFVQGTTVPASWLNDVNTATFNTIPTLAPLVSPSFTTPSLGAATAVSINGVTVNSTVLQGTNTGDQLVFRTIAVAGQPDVVADTTSDTLTFAAGTNVTITTNATTDTVTINSTASGALTLLATYNVVGGEATIDFLNTFTSAYDDYMIRLDGVSALGATVLRTQIAIAGTPIISNVYVIGSSALTSIDVSSTATASGRGCTGTITVNNVNNSRLRTIMTNTLTETTAGSTFTTTSSLAAITNTAAISGFRLFLSTATSFVNGTVRVYGYKNV